QPHHRGVVSGAHLDLSPSARWGSMRARRPASPRCVSPAMAPSVPDARAHLVHGCPGYPRRVLAPLRSLLPDVRLPGSRLPGPRLPALAGICLLTAGLAGCGTVRVPAGEFASDPVCAQIVMGAPE